MYNIVYGVSGGYLPQFVYEGGKKSKKKVVFDPATSTRDARVLHTI